MKQFIDKLIERLGEESKKWFDIWDGSIKDGDYDNYADGMNDAFDESIAIVNQLAEEFATDINVGNKLQTIDVSELLGEQGNDVWIACSERLPELGSYVVCSVNDKYADHNIIISRYGGEAYWHDGRISAWQPLPAPYQPKGE